MVLSLTSQRRESPRTRYPKGLKLRYFCWVGVGVGHRAGTAAAIGHLRTGSGGSRRRVRGGQRSSGGRGCLLVRHGADCRSDDVSEEKKRSSMCNFPVSCMSLFDMCMLNYVLLLLYTKCESVFHLFYWQHSRVRLRVASELEKKNLWWDHWLWRTNREQRVFKPSVLTHTKLHKKQMFLPAIKTTAIMWDESLV